MVIPATTTATVLLAMDLHGSGDSTSCSIRVAIRSEASSLSPPPGRPAPDSGSSAGSGIPMTRAASGGEPVRRLSEELGLLRLELLLGQDSLGLEVGELRELRGGVGALGSGRLSDVAVERRLLLGRLLGLAFVHGAAPGDQVHEHAEERKDDNEDHPQGLGASAHVVAAEDVEEHHHQQPDPDEEEEEVQNRQERVEYRVVRPKHECSPCGRWSASTSPSVGSFLAPRR